MERVEAAVVIQIPVPLVTSALQKKLDALSDEQAADHFTFFRVPAHIRERNKHLYQPRMVAIGPYGCRDEPSLRTTESLKLRYLQEFLSHYSGNRSINDYVAEILELEPRARQCYLEPIEHISKEKFVEMLLLDGCFILESLIKWNGWGNYGNKLLPMEGSMLTVLMDLLLLENQIPLFVLEELFKIGGTAATPVLWPEIPSLTELLVYLLTTVRVVGLGEEIKSSHDEEVTGNNDLIVPGEAKDFNHLLHFYYHLHVTEPQTDPTGCSNCGTILKWLNPSRIFTLLLPYVRSKTYKSNKKRFPGTIPSATELLEAGVTIKKKKKKNLNLNLNLNRPSSFLDVTFCPRHGVLEIPFLSVDNSTLPLFSNLVAFEQCDGCKPEEAYMSSYAAFMDCLINTPEDEAILRQRGILENNLASDKHLLVFFNQLSEWLILDFQNHYLAQLFGDVGEYCGSAWHKWRAKLMRDYFSNPWTIISLFAAAVLLILTILQTFYSIYTYYHPS